jgi:4-amino-4-deoxy-L-arabinose transferase-like glycosyltransferase
MLVAVFGVAAYAGDVAVRRLAPDLAGVPRWVAWALTATSALLLIHGVPLVLGLLSVASVLVMTALVGAASLVAARGARVRGAERAPAVPGGPEWLGAGLLVLAAGAALAYLRLHAAEPTLSSDTLNFQLPQVARWIQTGSMWQLDQFFPEYSNATYPHHGNVLLLAVVLPLDGTELARLVPVPYAGLTALAVYAAARELGAARGWALVAAALVLAIPIYAFEALAGANTDTPMTFFTVAGVLFLLRHHRTGARSDLVLAGVAFGLALGTKWYALTTLPPILAVWAFARWRAGDRWIADAARLAGLILLAGGIWLVRNTVETGNPLFPQPLGPLPAPVDTIREQAGWTLAHYLFDFDVWRTYLEPQFTDYFAAPGYLLTVVPFAAGAYAWRRRDGRAAAVAAAAIGCLALYFVTPYSAFGAEGTPTIAFASMRYAIPALLLGAVALAWLGTRAPRAAGLALAAISALAVLQGLRSGYDVGRGLVLSSAVVVALAVWAARRAGPRLAVAGAVVLLVAGAALVRDRADGRWYAGYDPVFNWLETNAPDDTRVALAGVWPVSGVSPALPAFGPRLDNDVAFAGPFVEHLLRAERDPRRFARRLRGFDVLVVGRGLVATGRPAPEESWARAAGFRPVVASDALALLVRQ